MAELEQPPPASPAVVVAIAAGAKTRPPRLLQVTLEATQTSAIARQILPPRHMPVGLCFCWPPPLLSRHSCRRRFWLCSPDGHVRRTLDPSASKSAVLDLQNRHRSIHGLATRASRGGERRRLCTLAWPDMATMHRTVAKPPGVFPTVSNGVTCRTTDGQSAASSRQWPQLSRRVLCETRGPRCARGVTSTVHVANLALHACVQLHRRWA